MWSTVLQKRPPDVWLALSPRVLSLGGPEDWRRKGGPGKERAVGTPSILVWEREREREKERARERGGGGRERKRERETDCERFLPSISRPRGRTDDCERQRTV